MPAGVGLVPLRKREDNGCSPRIQRNKRGVRRVADSRCLVEKSCYLMKKVGWEKTGGMDDCGSRKKSSLSQLKEGEAASDRKGEEEQMSCLRHDKELFFIHKGSSGGRWGKKMEKYLIHYMAGEKRGNGMYVSSSFKCNRISLATKERGKRGWGALCKKKTA